MGTEKRSVLRNYPIKMVLSGHWGYGTQFSCLQLLTFMFYSNWLCRASIAGVGEGGGL